MDSRPWNIHDRKFSIPSESKLKEVNVSIQDSLACVDVVPMRTEVSLEKPDGQWAGTRPFRSAPRPPSVLLPSAQSVRAPTVRAEGSFEAGEVPPVLLTSPPLHLPPAHNNSHRLPPSDSLAIIMYLHYSSLLLMYPRPLSITSGIPRKYP